MFNSDDTVKILMLKGDKGEKGENGEGVYDDTEIRQLIADETLARANADAAMDTEITAIESRVGVNEGNIATNTADITAQTNRQTANVNALLERMTGEASFDGQSLFESVTTAQLNSYRVGSVVTLYLRLNAKLRSNTWASEDFPIFSLGMNFGADRPIASMYHRVAYNAEGDTTRLLIGSNGVVSIRLGSALSGVSLAIYEVITYVGSYDLELH